MSKTTKRQQKKNLQMKIGDERRIWNVNPVTRVVNSKKSYNRNREKRSLREINDRED